ncbi:MAG: hypothetical protein AAGI22_02920 [Planctomycetota bacterium]
MRRHPVAALGAVPLAWAVLGAPLQYAPESGARDEQSWSVRHSLALVELSLETGDGEPANAPEMTMKATRSRSLTIAQVHDEAADGAPVVLTRTYGEVEESIDASFMIPNDGLDETLDASIDAPLDDVTVRFRWDEDEDDWSRSLVDESGEETEGQEDAIARLAVDAHLAGLLDELEEAEEGASWEAEPQAIAALVLPGGGLGGALDASPSDDRPFESHAAGVDPLLGMDLHLLLLGESEGEVSGDLRCTLKELPKDDAGNATIGIEVDLTATRDITEHVLPWLDALTDDVAVDLSSASATLRMQGAGEVEWNVATGLPTSVSLDLTLAYTLEREAELVTPGGDEIVILTTVELEGDLSSEMSTDM